MFSKILLSVLIAASFANPQKEMVYFPDGQGGLIDTENTLNLPPNLNLTEMRGTNAYEHYVDQIIASGIAKLTLAINKALNQQTHGGRHSDNVVFAPVSIAGALALILLGSNGRTFQEINSVLGLAIGVDIGYRSLQVHEQFGRMIEKLERTSGFSMGQQVNFAAAIFVQKNYPLRTVYVKTAQDLYESEVLSVDFRGDSGKAQETINSWVTQKTNGKIKNILAEEPLPDTRVIIASAMYFKALWEKPFFEGGTNRRPFFTNGRKAPATAEVDMMANGGDFPYFRDETLKCEVMGFPYQGNASTMYVVMPLDSDKRKLRDLEESITPSDLQRLADSTVYTGAVLIFPKMKIESTIDLKTALELLGVKSLFIPSEANLALLSPGENYLPVTAKVPLTLNQNSGSILADRFSDAIDCSSSATAPPCGSKVSANNTHQNVVEKKVDNKTGRKVRASETIDNLRRIINQQSMNNSYQNPGLYADKVIHKVYMDITETGTEAAASTSVSLSKDGSRVTFRVDVPFFFFIRNEETKTILFWGSVTVPTPNFHR